VSNMCDTLRRNKEKGEEMRHGNEGQSREQKKDSKVIGKKARR